MTAGSGEAGVRAEKTLDAALPLPNKKNMQRVFDFLRENSLQYCATVGLDKKRAGDSITLIFLSRLGQTAPTKMKKDELLALLEPMFGR